MKKFKKSKRKRKRVYFCNACKDMGKSSKGGNCICVAGIRSNKPNPNLESKE